MFELELSLLLPLVLAAFFAGFVDAMVGGGGLVQIPALFTMLPSVQPATLLGTNKLSSVVGTIAATFQYASKVKIVWLATLPAALMAFPGAFFGAWLITKIPGDNLRLILPVILTVVAVYTFIKKDLGSVHSPRMPNSKILVFVSCLMGFCIGFYDGVFGPGTGSFLMLGFVVIFGFDFLSATASAKVVNVVCNLSALAWFVPSGHVYFLLGGVMALSNVVGAMAGARYAVKGGVALVRKVFLFVVACLVFKTSYDAYGQLLLY